MKYTCGNRRISLWEETEENMEMKTFPENSGCKSYYRDISLYYKTSTEVVDRGDKATLPVGIDTGSCTSIKISP